MNVIISTFPCSYPHAYRSPTKYTVIDKNSTAAVVISVYLSLLNMNATCPYLFYRRKKYRYGQQRGLRPLQIIYA